jgi:hypothetical protein
MDSIRNNPASPVTSMDHVSSGPHIMSHSLHEKLVKRQAHVVVEENPKKRIAPDIMTS